MITLTIVETECKKTLDQLYLYLTSIKAKRVNLGTYADIVNSVQKALNRLKNKEYGCPSGLHAGACFCTFEKEGLSNQSGK